MITAILTAGGIGSRMQNNIPKQFITVNEIPIIIYTLQQFQKNANIDKVVIACVKEWQAVLRAYCKEFDINKLDKIVDGGDTGLESIRNCFTSLENTKNSDIILVHDGNRPLVDDEIINNNIKAIKKSSVTTTYIDIHDGIIKVNDSGKILKDKIKREEIKSTQTPHTFRYDIAKEILSKIIDPNEYISLADAAAKMDYDISLVKGSEINFKITTSNDLVLFEAIINSKI